MDLEIFKMNSEHVKMKNAIVDTWSDCYGNRFELIEGYMNSEGVIIRIVLRNNALKYLKVLHEIKDDVAQMILKFK